MAVDERARHELYQRLEQALGEEATATLMTYLPPTGWQDVATKHELARLEERMDARFAAVDAKFEALMARMDARFETVDAEFVALEERVLATMHRELASTTRTIIFGLLSAQVALAGLALALARFAA